jgi:hypothetical protein
MKKCRPNSWKKTLVGMTLLCSGFAIGHAETALLVKNRLGVSTNLGLNAIQKLTFSNAIVNIVQKDASVLEFNRSDIRTLSFATITGLAPVKTASTINLYRNPVSEILSGSFSLKGAESVHLQILTLDGRVECDETIQGVLGNNEFALPVQSLSNGMYLLRIQSKSIQFSTKFIKK